MEQALALSWAQRRSNVVLALRVLGLVIAAAGIYGVMTFIVQQPTQSSRADRVGAMPYGSAAVLVARGGLRRYWSRERARGGLGLSASSPRALRSEGHRSARLPGGRGVLAWPAFWPPSSPPPRLARESDRARGRTLLERGAQRRLSPSVLPRLRLLFALGQALRNSVRRRPQVAPVERLEVCRWQVAERYVPLVGP